MYNNKSFENQYSNTNSDNSSGNDADSGAWMRDPELRNISPVKLLFLEKIFHQMPKMPTNGDKAATGEKFKKEMLPFLLSLSKLSKENNISFSSEEIEVIYRVLQKYSSAEDIAKMRRVFSLFGSR